MDWDLNWDLFKSIWWKVNIFSHFVIQMRCTIFQEGLFRLANFGGTTLTYYAFVAPPTPPKVAEKTKAFDLPSHINEQSDSVSMRFL